MNIQNQTPTTSQITMDFPPPECNSRGRDILIFILVPLLVAPLIIWGVWYAVSTLGFLSQADSLWIQVIADLGIITYGLYRWCKVTIIEVHGDKALIYDDPTVPSTRNQITLPDESNPYPPARLREYNKGICIIAPWAEFRKLIDLKVGVDIPGTISVQTLYDPTSSVPEPEQRVSFTYQLSSKPCLGWLANHALFDPKTIETFLRDIHESRLSQAVRSHPYSWFMHAFQDPSNHEIQKVFGDILGGSRHISGAEAAVGTTTGTPVILKAQPSEAMKKKQDAVPEGEAMTTFLTAAKNSLPAGTDPAVIAATAMAFKMGNSPINMVHFSGDPAIAKTVGRQFLGQNQQGQGKKNRGGNQGGNQQNNPPQNPPPPTPPTTI